VTDTSGRRWACLLSRAHRASPLTETAAGGRLPTSGARSPPSSTDSAGHAVAGLDLPIWRGTAARRPWLRHRRERSLCPLPVLADRPAHSTVGSSGTSGGPVTRQPGKHQRGSRPPRRRDRRARLVAGRTRTEGTSLSSPAPASISLIETGSRATFSVQDIPTHTACRQGACHAEMHIAQASLVARLPRLVLLSVETSGV
jgi:hypothetical protein